jgi:DNA-binding NarL/FixJ family response regulator
MGLDAGTPALRAIRDGGTYIDRPLSDLLRSRGSGQASGSVPVLSAREIEVLEMVVIGLSNGGIATRLFISPETVKSHITSLLTKLGARDRTHAAVRGLRLGLVDWPQEG